MIIVRGGEISGEDKILNRTMEPGGFYELEKKPMKDEKARTHARIWH